MELSAVFAELQKVSVQKVLVSWYFFKTTLHLHARQKCTQILPITQLEADTVGRILVYKTIDPIIKYE